MVGMISQLSDKLSFKANRDKSQEDMIVDWPKMRHTGLAKVK